MNWDAIGAVTEGLGAAAVFITLAYLAVQVRHAKDAAADTSRLNRAVGVRELITEMVADDDLRRAWIQAEKSEDQLGSLAEALQVSV